MVTPHNPLIISQKSINKQREAEKSCATNIRYPLFFATEM